jgi:hypothetical protein
MLSDYQHILCPTAGEIPGYEESLTINRLEKKNLSKGWERMIAGSGRWVAGRWMERSEVVIIISSGIVGAEESRWASVGVRWPA